MGRVIAYMLIMAGTLYAALLYGSASFLMLFYAECLVFILLWGSLMWLRKQLQVSLHVPIPVASRLDTVPVEMVFQNKAWIPCGRVTAKLYMETVGNHKEKSRDMEGRIPAGYTRRIRQNMVIHHVGVTKLKLRKVRCYDMLGIFWIPLPQAGWCGQSQEQVLVLPELLPLLIRVSQQSRNFVGESEVYAQDRVGHAVTEQQQIRDYRPGDSLRSIHWKLTAKMEEVMVTEQALPLSCPVLLYLDTYCSQKYGKKSNMDQYWQIAGSLSYSLSLEQCKHYVIWYDRRLGDVRRFSVDTVESVYEMLYQVMESAEYPREKVDLEEMYRRKYHETLFVTKIIWNGIGSLNVGDDVVDLTSWQDVEIGV